MTAFGALGRHAARFRGALAGAAVLMRTNISGEDARAHSHAEASAHTMWQLYRKTFWRMQAMIWAVTACVYLFLGQMPSRAAVFFAIMQVSAVIGAVWGVRL